MPPRIHLRSVGFQNKELNHVIVSKAGGKPIAQMPMISLDYSHSLRLHI